MNPSYQSFATHDESEYPELWDGCVGAWAPCLGPSGTRLHDNSGKANWGTLTNMDAATDWVVNSGQYALDFDGTNDYFDIPSAATLPIDLSIDFTLNSWLFVRANTGVIWTHVVSGITTVFLDLASNRIGTRGQSGSLAYFAAPAILNRWVMITLRRMGGALSMFFDGVPSATPPVTGSIGSFLFSRFGVSFQAALPLNAIVGDQTMHSRGLSMGEIATMRRIGQGGMYTSLRRRKAYFGQLFNAAWARGSNVTIQPCGVA